ncbi:hypothetical protein PMAC_001406 [Pneumocystis sp. 'macacae']|nr:hypothetical protein PMAC_001406 [Pneumocystis sp. 'macacae']
MTERSLKTSYILKRWVHRPPVQKQWILPEDLGMLDAYVPPSRNCLPAFWKAPTQRMRLIWRWFYHRMKGWFERKLFEQSIRPIEVDFKQLHVTVGKIYEKVNQAYAKGNIKEIALFCGPAYAQTLKSQIEKRPAGFELKWQLHRMITPPKLVSFSHAKVEFNSNRYLAQAIYRIHSEQVFFLILERKGAPEPYKWYIWGKTTEASPDSVKVKIWKNGGNLLKMVIFLIKVKANIF